VLAVLANFVLSLEEYGLLAQLAVNLAGLAMLACFGMLLGWYRGGGHLPRPPAFTPAPDPA